jgi:Peptidase family M28
MKKILLPILLLAGSPWFAGAQTLQNDQLYRHLSFLTADSLHGRGTGEEAERQSAQYIETKLREYGLKPANGDRFLQPFSILRREHIECSIRIGDKTFRNGDDFLVNFPVFKSLALQSNEFVYAGYGLSDEAWDDYQGLDVKGKIVLVSPGVPDVLANSSRYAIFDKYAAAYRKGAKAIFYLQPLLPFEHIEFGQIIRKEEISLPEEDQSTFYMVQVSPAIAITIFGKAAYQWIARHPQVPLQKRLRAKRAYGSRVSFTTRTDTAYNVIALLEGSDLSGEYIINAAHYDHLGEDGGKIFHGADDNGSGTAALLEIARVLAEEKKLGKGLRRSVVFSFFSGEEKGLLGSNYYLQNPLFPPEATKAMLNMDMISKTGTVYKNKKDSSNYIFLVGDDRAGGSLGAILNKENAATTKLILDRRYNSPADIHLFLYRSDHFPFLLRQIPAVWFFNGEHAEYHLDTDTMETINWEVFMKRTLLVLNCTRVLANR